MLQVIIIDDEPMGINTIKVLIERLEMGTFILATTTDAEKGIELIDSLHPDVVFLDVNMPKLNGFELLEKLTYKDFKLVFTTAHQEYALKAIKNKAFDYLLKPIDANDLKLCLDSIELQINTTIINAKHRSLIELVAKDGVLFIKQIDVFYIEAAGSYSIIYLSDGKKHTASKNLKYFETILDPNQFYRCHQSYIVNINQIVKLNITRDGYFAILSNNASVEIGKMQKDELIFKLKNI